MSIRSIPNIARYATTSAAPKPKVLVIGAGTFLFAMLDLQVAERQDSKPCSLRCIQKAEKADLQDLEDWQLQTKSTMLSKLRDKL